MSDPQKSGRLAIIPARAVDDPKLGNAALRLLCALGAYADREGRCWPSIETLARRLGKSHRHVKRVMQKLTELGYVDSGRRFDMNGSETTAVRTILINGERGPETTASPPGGDAGSHPGVAQDVTPRVTPETTPGVTYHVSEGVAQDVTQNVPMNDPIERMAQSASDAVVVATQFTTFWRTFPSRRPHPNPKKPAEHKFAAALKRGVPAEIIIRGARNYRAYVEAENPDPRHVAQAVTWLNQERWNDHQETPAPRPRNPGIC